MQLKDLPSKEELKNTNAEGINLVIMVILPEITTSGSIQKVQILQTLTNGITLASTHIRYAHTMMIWEAEDINAKVTQPMEIGKSRHITVMLLGIGVSMSIHLIWIWLTDIGISESIHVEILNMLAPMVAELVISDA